MDADANPCARVPLSRHTKRKLWAESAGFCGNPGCAQPLFVEEAEVDFAEMAHIISATPGGPRDRTRTSGLSVPERANFSNVLILCANCHTTVDKAPDAYPEELIQQWKAKRAESNVERFGTPRFETRSDARQYVLQRLEANRAIFERYGPSMDDFSEERAALWRRHVKRSIIPTNAEIRRVLNNNMHLATSDERSVIALFGIHSVELEDRHILHDFTAGATRFPEGMAMILEEEEV